MAVDLIKFVDSIASSPTVRLDVNDGTVWRCGKFDAPPPQLRRATSSNAMRDGIFVSSSQYDARTLTLELALVHSSEDNAATEWQKLARELDRADNFLMYQPTGATKPVFFRLYRSDVPAFDQFTGGAQAFKKPTIRLLAEPFALGLRETLGPFTVNNDPAAGSNGLFVDLTGVIGDVAMPAVYRFSSGTGLREFGYLAIRQHGTPSALVHFQQAESGTLGTDTTNPGGGPDAAMSGTGTNNFVRCSFATATMATRLTATPFGQVSVANGRYRILACIRRSDSTSAMQMRLQRQGAVSVTPGTTVTLALTTNRTIVDLGLYEHSASPTALGYSVQEGNAAGVGIPLGASRTSGTGTLDIDYVLALPADEAQAVYDLTGDAGSNAILLDGHTGQLAVYDPAGDPFAGTAYILGAYPFSSVPLVTTGSIPTLRPNQTNRLYLVQKGSSQAHTKTDTISVTADYWPRYLFVRPTST